MWRCDSEARKGLDRGGIVGFHGAMGALEAMLGSLRRRLDGFPGKRRGLNTRYAMGDIGMAAFSVFFMQSPSFLAHQRRFEEGHGQSNCKSLFGTFKIPRAQLPHRPGEGGRAKDTLADAPISHRPQG